MLNNTVPINNNYYIGVSGLIIEAGYEQPSTDADERQRQIWDYIRDNQIAVRLETKFDFLNQLAPHESPSFKYFQSRQNCENEDKVDKLYSEFYEFGEPMKRLPMGFVLDDGMFYPAVGNHRSRSHQKGMKAGYQSRGGVLILGTGLPESEKKEHGFSIATLSNADNADQTERETEDDIIHQVLMFFELESNRRPEMKNWDMATQKKWAVDWIKETKYGYKHSNMAIRVGNIANAVFSKHRGQSLPFPDAETIAKTFNRFWNRSTWNPSEQTKIQQIEIQAHTQFIRNTLTHRWRTRPAFSPVRDKVWLVTRCGYQKHSNVTSMETIKKNRITFIENMRGWNANPSNIGAGFQIIERIMFVKQLNQDSDEAFEWNEQSQQFDQIEFDK